MTFKVGDPVKFNHPEGSVGRVTAVRGDGPFKTRPGYYVEWVYGRDVKGDRMTGRSLEDDDSLVLITEDAVKATEERKGWGEKA